MTQEAALRDDRLATRDERLRRSASAVQHDINNAMMVLASNLEMLARHLPEGPPRRQLDRAREAARRLDEVMRGFLDALRRPGGELVRIAPALAVSQALALLRVALGGRARIELAPTEAVAEVLLDRAALDAALLALVQDMALAPGSVIGLVVQEADGAVALAVTLPEGVALPESARAALALAGALAGALAAGPVLSWPIATGTTPSP